jgi:hypothetical protein
LEQTEEQTTTPTNTFGRQPKLRIDFQVNQGDVDLSKVPRNTAHMCFSDPSHWKPGFLWRRLAFGKMPATTCDRLLSELSLVYVQLMTTHSHAHIKSNHMWPPKSLFEKYPNCFTVTENVS